VTFVLKNAADMKLVCELLQKKTWQDDGVWVISTYNTFHASCSKAQYQNGGYRDLKMLVLLEIDAVRLLVELQVHLYTFYRLKEPQMHLTYEFVRGSMDWPSQATKNWYRRLREVWSGLEGDRVALRRIRRSIDFLASEGAPSVLGRKEFESILQQEWSWSDGEGGTNTLENEQISWFWELSLAGNDNGAEGHVSSDVSEIAKKSCPGPSVGTWLTELLESPVSETATPKIADGHQVLRRELKVDYKKFCEDFFGVELLYADHDLYIH